MWGSSHGLLTCSRSKAEASDAEGCSLEAVRQCPHLLRELRWLMHREVDAQHGDPQRQPGDVVVARPVLAAVRVDRLDRSPVGWDPPGDLLSRRTESDARLEAVGRRN